MSPIAGPVALALNLRWVDSRLGLGIGTEPDPEHGQFLMHRFAGTHVGPDEPGHGALLELDRISQQPPGPYSPGDKSSRDSSRGSHPPERSWWIPENQTHGPGEIPKLLALVVAKAQAPLAPPRLMGVLNVTPDSFSDGGKYFDPSAALDHALSMVAQGATLLDIGGESTRPGSKPVSTEEEWSRVGSVIERLAGTCGASLSIDTSKAEVARRAVAAGATWINDISAGTFDPGMLDQVAACDATFVAMHCMQTPDRMQEDVCFGDVVAEVCLWLRKRLAAFEQSGISLERVVLDPGIGFGKHLEHNLALLRRLWEFRSLGCPLLLGVSRKSFIARLDQAERSKDLPVPDPNDRIGGTASAIATCVQGGASVLRVHDVATMGQAARMAYALLPSRLRS